VISFLVLVIAAVLTLDAMPSATQPLWPNLLQFVVGVGLILCALLI